MSVDPNWVTALAAVGGFAVGNVMLYMLQRRQYNLTSLTQIFGMITTEEQIRARQQIFAISKEYKQNGDISIYDKPDNYLAFIKVHTSLEMLSAMFLLNAVPRNIVLALFSRLIIDSWEALLPYIDHMRKKEGYAALSINFQSLYNYAKAHKGNIA